MFLKFFDDKRKSCIDNFKVMMMMMIMMMITGDKMRNSMIIIIKKNVAVSLIALKTFNENQNI